MNQETPSDSSLSPRNRAALASLFISLIFFSKNLFFLAVIAIARWSSWAVKLSKSNPHHPFFGLVEIVVELSVLVPLDLVAGALAILFGIRGLRAARRLSSNLGENRSIAGIALGLLVLLLPFVVILCWASAWKQ